MKTIRLEPAAIGPGQVEQLSLKLEERTLIRGIKLDDPETFEVIKIIAGTQRVDVGALGPEAVLSIDIAPPNAFVTVLVRSKLTGDTNGDIKVCGGELLCEGESTTSAQHVVTPQVQTAGVMSGPVAFVPAPPKPAQNPIPGAGGGTITLKTDERGWPLGGQNEVWVLMNRGEAERMLQAINGYPITGGERPALLRRFQQALGLIR